MSGEFPNRRCGKSPRLAVVVVLAALVALGLPGGTVARGAGSEAECAWHRHTVRVVKRVRRHGKVRRVVRHRVRWSCDPVAGTPAAGAPESSPPVTAPSESEPEAANHLGVKAHEYQFVLSRPSVSAGEVTVELNNQGEDPHDLNLQRESESGSEPVLEISETASQQHQVAHFELPPGTYRLWCSLPEHEEKGMHATLVVAGG